MRAAALLARVVLALHALQSFEEITGKNVLTLKEEWSNADEKQSTPQVNLSTVLVKSENVCVRVRVRMEPLCNIERANRTLQIKLTDLATTKTHSILVWSHENNTVQWKRLSGARSRRVEVDLCSSTNKEHLNVRKTPVWLLQFDCFNAQRGHAVFVSVRDFKHTLTNASYIVEHLPASITYLPADPVPRSEVRVDTSAKLFMVAMDAGQHVKARLCYKNLQPPCNGSEFKLFLINTDLQRTLNMSFPHLVPCICSELFYTGEDPPRDRTCPFKDQILPGGGDILPTSSVKLYGSSVLEWKPLCPSDPTKPSVSLCWQHYENHSQCFSVHNSTLPDRDLKYDVTAVDKHAHICVKFSLNDSHRVFCPFSSGAFSEWDVTVVPGSQRLHVRLYSRITASFAAQLCAEEQGEYVAKGNVHSVQMVEGAKEVELNLPLPLLIHGLCVQVWRSEPALYGKRIICPDYTHRRWGLIVAVSFAFLVTVTTMGFLACILIKKKTSVWRCAERKPLLLVCSSDDAAHVAAVCTLASGLQEELCLDVRLAQWAHCSTQASLAELGPVPWLYGQYKEVQRAGGMVLLAWSLEAQQAFLQWKESEGKEERKGSWWRGKVSDKEKDTAWSNAQLEDQKDKQKDIWLENPKEMSSVRSPLLNATFSCLWAGLYSKSCGQKFGLVCFWGFGCNNHIPKDLRGVRRYCLPRDLSSLIHELDLKDGSLGGGVKEVSRGWCCWPRLFSKALSFWVSQRLAQRLATWLPQTDSEQDREKSKSKHKPHSKNKRKKKIGRNKRTGKQTG